MNLGNRIKQLRKKQNLSQTELAELCGWDSPGRVANYENSSREPTINDIIKIAKALKSDPSFLIFGQSINFPISSSTIVFDNFYTIPLIQWQDIALSKDELSDLIAKNEYEMIPMFGMEIKDCYALKVKGDSMVSTLPGNYSFPEGEIIIVNPSESPQNGDFVVALHKETKEPLFKQFIVDAGKKYLKSLNQYYPIIEFEDDIEIVGVVKKYGSFKDIQR